MATAVLAFPLAYYMARYATPRARAFLMLAVLMPLWSSYLVRVYFWKLILAREGVVSYLAASLGLAERWSGCSPCRSWAGPRSRSPPSGAFVAFVYVGCPT